jgi:hypothetical protein
MGPAEEGEPDEPILEDRNDLGSVVAVLKTFIG